MSRKNCPCYISSIRSIFLGILCDHKKGKLSLNLFVNQINIEEESYYLQWAFLYSPSSSLSSKNIKNGNIWQFVFYHNLIIQIYNSYMYVLPYYNIKFQTKWNNFHQVVVKLWWPCAVESQQKTSNVKYAWSQVSSEKSMFFELYNV